MNQGCREYRYDFHHSRDLLKHVTARQTASVVGDIDHSDLHPPITHTIIHTRASKIPRDHTLKQPSNGALWTNRCIRIIVTYTAIDQQRPRAGLFL